MLRRLFRGLGKRHRLRLRESVTKSLALHRRGEARADDPILMDLTVKMQMRWRARELHPWDRDLSTTRGARKLAQQTLSDTEAALERLFEACPDVDVIELSVIEPNPDGNRRVIFGTVRRDEFAQWHPLSTDMRLRLLGLHYRLVDENLEPLPPERFSGEQDSRPIIGGFSGDLPKSH
jgi:hypothetical protein